MIRLTRFTAPAPLILALLIPAHDCLGATITIVNADAAGEGFNDPAPVSPVGGNSGTTVGAQRLFVFQHAANIWGAILPSTIEIKVNAHFDPLSCTANSGVLGSAGPVSVFRDFGGAPFGATWYHVALANRLAGTDLDPAGFDINATFNSGVGGPSCLTPGWYYGVDGIEGSQIELLPVVLHELGHGLGFSSTTNGGTGALLGGFPGSYDHFLLDNATGLHWPDMSAPQRVASAVGCRSLAWDGAATTGHASLFLGAGAQLRVSSPAGIAGDIAVGVATFGPAVNTTGVTGQVVLANDGVGNPSNGCEPFLNDLTGKIALVDRGACGFSAKVKNAQIAGAIGAIVADSVAGCPAPGMSGSDATITIPSVRVTQADGNILKANLGAGVNATILLDPARGAGTDAGGRVLVYTPNSFSSGSSVSHWDVSAEPSLLMEPAITQGLSSGVDLTRYAFADLGWFAGATAVTDGIAATRHELLPASPNPSRGFMRLSFSLAHDDNVNLAIYNLVGARVARLAAGHMSQGRHSIAWDGKLLHGGQAPAGVYLCRLQAPGFTQSQSLVITR